MKPASPQSLVRLETLHTEIAQLARQLNRPYSLLSSLILTNMLASHSLSPLRWFYDDLYHHYAKDFLLAIYKSGHYTNLRNYMEVIGLKFKDLTALIRDPQFADGQFATAGTPFELEYFFQQADQVLQNTPAAFVVKKNLAHIYNHFRALLATEFQGQLFLHDPGIAESQLTQHTIKGINQKITVLYQALDKLLTHNIGGKNNLAARNHALYHVNHWMFASKLCAGLLIQYYAAEPLINYLFPNGIFQAKLPPLTYCLTTQQADNTLQALEKHRNNLAKTAYRNNKFARLLSILLLPLAFYFLMNGRNDLSAELVVFYFTLFNSSLLNLKIDIEMVFNYYLLNYWLKKQEALIRTALENQSYVLTCTIGNNLATSYFEIKFTKHTKLSAKAIATQFKEACIFYKIKNINWNNNNVTLPGHVALTAKTAQAINNSLINNITKKLTALTNSKIVVSSKAIKATEEDYIQPFIDLSNQLYKANKIKKSKKEKPKSITTVTLSLPPPITKTVYETKTTAVPAESLTIKWRSGSYNANPSTHDIFPIRSTHNRFFAMNTLNKNLFDPNTQPIFDKFNEFLPKLKFGPKKASQVIVPWFKQEKDQYNNVFQASAKFKFLGFFGAIRVYAKTEQALTPGKETLLIFKGIKLSHE